MTKKPTSAFEALAAVDPDKDTLDLILEMIEALELCLECELSWEAEQAAEILVERAKSRLKQHG